MSFGAPTIVASGWTDGLRLRRTASWIRGSEQGVHRANEMLPEMTPETPLVAPGGGAGARFDQALATRIVELTVHGLDLAAATDSASTMSPRALSITGHILDVRLDGDRPVDLAADAQWVVAATGRAPHADSRLPVMS